MPRVHDAGLGHGPAGQGPDDGAAETSAPQARVDGDGREVRSAGAGAAPGADGGQRAVGLLDREPALAAPRACVSAVGEWASRKAVISSARAVSSRRLDALVRGVLGGSDRRVEPLPVAAVHDPVALAQPRLEVLGDADREGPTGGLHHRGDLGERVEQRRDAVVGAEQVDRATVGPAHALERDRLVVPPPRASRGRR